MSTSTVSYTTLGLDIGTTTMHALVSQVEVRRIPGSATLELENYQSIHISPVRLTPYSGDQKRIDEVSVLAWVRSLLAEWNLDEGVIATGAIIATGVAATKENAFRVQESLSSLCGNMVATVAGSRLESWLAAQGAGVVAWSRENLKNVVSIDIGGGTSNIACVRNGERFDEASLWIGGRMIQFDESGQVRACHPALQAFCTNHSLPCRTLDDAILIMDTIATSLIEFVQTGRVDACLVDEPFRRTGLPLTCSHIALSGGVAEAVHEENPLAHSDAGVLLARALERLMPAQWTRLPVHDPIRATVIGAGVYSTHVSGDTIFCTSSNLLPRRNCTLVELPVSENQTADALHETLLAQLDLYSPPGDFVIAVRTGAGMRFSMLECISEAMARYLNENNPPHWMMVIEADVAKLLGIMIEDQPGIAGKQIPLLIMDRISVADSTQLDIGTMLPDGSVPVTVKKQFHAEPVNPRRSKPFVSQHPATQANHHVSRSS